MSLHTLLSDWRVDFDITSNIAAWRTTPARPARFTPFSEDLHPALSDSLRDQSISALYTHQASTWEHVSARHNPVVVTGTASGKTLCYNLPVLDRLLRDPAARALYLFPTKALAQDQKNVLEQLISTSVGRPPAPISPRGGAGSGSLQPLAPGSQQPAIPVATYDGDTPAETRRTIRTTARLVISNPDMLHAGVLPHHTLWADFFQHLRFVVIDEMHVYRGVFGSHVANVLRRL